MAASQTSVLHTLTLDAVSELSLPDSVEELFDCEPLAVDFPSDLPVHLDVYQFDHCELKGLAEIANFFLFSRASEHFF